LPWSLTGFPALTLPVSLDSQGLPVGLTLAAPPDTEAELLAVGCTLDEHLGFWRTQP
jgi:aspartyl-tRNA(Asn)/glutamyl-tRNA(Gln) amidotransferase subunit A